MDKNEELKALKELLRITIKHNDEEAEQRILNKIKEVLN